jgi:hypothetical protein
MDRIDEEGALLLAPLKNAEPSLVSGVDVTRAMRAGRRQGRRRVVAGVVTAASLTVLPMLGVPSLVHNRTEPTATTAAVPPSLIDLGLFREVVSVGSAGGFTPASYTTGITTQRIDLIRADGGTGTATILVHGRSPADWLPSPADRTPAAAVNGQRAFWHAGALYWEWDPDAWASVSSEAKDSDIADRLYRVALSVTSMTDEWMTFPFTIPEPDDPMTAVAGVETKDVRSVHVVLADKKYDKPVVAVGMGWAGPGGQQPNDTVNGHDAVVTDNAVMILNVDGRGAMAFARSDLPAQVGGIAGLKQLAASVKPVADPANSASWLRYPFR